MPSEPGAPDDGPSLEMPSFSLRRKKKAASAVAPEPAPERAPEPVPEPEPVAAPDPDPAPVAVVVDEPAPHEPRPRRELAVPGVVAALGAGLVVGLLAVVLTWLAGVGCDAVRGTTSCGGAIGLPVLVVGLALLAWVGSLLLRALGVGDPGSTSVLAVGILAVLVMVFLLGSIDEWWMVIAIPALAIVGYLVSWWVTTAVVANDDGSEVDTPEPYDVR
jgi:hypothetical protein